MLQLRHSRRLLATTGGVLAVFVLIATFVVSSPIAFAGNTGASGAGGDGTGGGGSSGCGSSGHWTCNGWGWARYTVKDGSVYGKGPSESTFRNGTTKWNDPAAGNGVVQRCDAAGASTVDIFIINDENGSAQGYNYKDYYMGPPVYSNHFDATDPVDHGRGSAISTDRAQKDFNDPGVPKAGLNFGSNVAWFCSNFTPKWNLEGTSDANKSTAKPGENVTFYHQVHNNGPDPADYGWRVQMAVNPSNDGNGDNDGWTNARGGGNWPKGSPEDVAKNANSPSRSNYADVYGNNAKFTIPNDANNGDKYCQRIEYSNAVGPNSRNFPDNAAHSNKKCITVEKAPTEGTEGSATGDCNLVNVESVGTYNARATRVIVKVDHVKVKRYNGDPITPYNDIPAAGASDSDSNHITTYDSVVYAAVPDENGDKSQKKRRWYYEPTAATIHVKVVQQWYYEGGDDPDTKNITETTWGKGWHTIPDTTVIDKDVSCVTASCTVNYVVGHGLGGRVMVGDKDVLVNATIRNTTSPSTANTFIDNPYLAHYKGSGGWDSSSNFDYSDGAGALYSGGFSDVEMKIDAPTTLKNINDTLAMWGGGVDGLNPSCPLTASVYKLADFGYSTSVSLDDQENPTNVNYSTSISNNAGIAINNFPSRHDVYNKSSPLTPLDASQQSSLPNGGYSWSGNKPIGPVNAGDKYCINVWSGPLQIPLKRIIKGYVDASGNIDNATYGDALEKCDTVHNEPYVHLNGADVSAGGKFEDEGGSCDNPGKIQTFSKESATGKPVGSGVHIGALAIGPIEGFNSANIRDSAPVAPIGLTFSNTDNTSGGSLNARSHGGNLGGNNCVTDYYGTKPSDTAADTTTTSLNLTAADSGTATKTTKIYDMTSAGVPLTITGGNIANNNNKAIYVKGDVKITRDIKLADNWGTIEAIPSLYIIASGNIYISKDVTQLDGIYIAQPRQGAPANTTGYINTCANGTARYVLSSPAIWADCRSQLVVNGAFVAHGVYLERTPGTLRKGLSGEHYNNPSASRDCADGATTTLGDCAAEIFNFGAEQYLAQPAITPKGGPNTGKYDYITSLAPVL